MERFEAVPSWVWLCDVQAGIVMMAEEGQTPADPSLAADPTPEPVAKSDSEVVLAPAPEPEPALAAKPVGEDWWQRRINKLTARGRSLEEENTTLKQQLASQVQPVVKTDTAGTPEYQSAVRTEAERLNSVDRFNQQCADVAEAGKNAFGEDLFNKSVASLVSVIDRTDQEEVAQYRALIEAAISTGEAARVVHLLGSDLNEATRLLGLPPARMGVELAKLALTKPDQTTTHAPTPANVPRGAGGGTAPHTSIDPTDPERSDKLSTAEWMRRRNEQDSRFDNRARGSR